jgi:hypothetical protein
MDFSNVPLRKKGHEGINRGQACAYQKNRFV